MVENLYKGLIGMEFFKIVIVQTTHECIHIPSQKALEPPCQLHIYISIIYIKAIPLFTFSIYFLFFTTIFCFIFLLITHIPFMSLPPFKVMNYNLFQEQSLSIQGKTQMEVEGWDCVHQLAAVWE